MLAFFVFAFIKYNGIEEELKVYTDDVLYLPINAYYKFSIILGIVIGLFYAIIETLFDGFLAKRFALGVSILVKAVIYFVLIIILLSVFSVLIEVQIDIDLPNERGWWYKDAFFWSTILYFTIASIVFSLLKITNDKFGSGVFINMLLGTYKKPKEEVRILMFLDLKDSTRIAEELGHKRYSQFIQDCFRDLNSVLKKHEAEVYQYVGDEAVLSWTTKKGFRKNNAVHLFFAFSDTLSKHKSKYLQLYGTVPEFKAGLHCGKLMIAEVGTIKKELAYHGDVINTAARIQGLCNSYNATLLVSQALLERSLITLDYKAELLGDIDLKGKAHKLKIYSVTKKGGN
jgi:adenylate cyclase